ncbi:hypothetical protein TCAL_08111 [Tigriopus californicus]|uniref:THAP-type domain-containing protein n=1 Tax=Tigriopus californicus TaxID=6832 RepID=A0A553PJN6_TIGCA|nr:uncharacterized protein LOC131889859 isoform X2 [Tigriopus californicus]TRY77895.1 hypothetical protein TCAL_08111 [Tigriopus californicus]
MVILPLVSIGVNSKHLKLRMKIRVQHRSNYIMVKSCSAFGCVNRAKKGISSWETSFHCFPQVPELRQKWVHAIRRHNFTPTRWSSICSDHFRDEDFESNLEVKRLKSEAVPSIFKGFPHHARSRVKSTRTKVYRPPVSPSPPLAQDPSEGPSSEEPPLSPSMFTESAFLDCPALFSPEESPYLDSDPSLSTGSAGEAAIPTDLSLTGHGEEISGPSSVLRPGQIPPFHLTHQARIARDHNYNCSPDIDLVRWKMLAQQSLIVEKVKKVERFKQQCHKFKKKNQELIESLKEARSLRKKLRSAEDLVISPDRFSSREFQVVKDFVQAKPGRHRYSEESKTFAMALHKCSPQAYQLVSSLFTLPCSTTFRKLVASTDRPA